MVKRQAILGVVLATLAIVGAVFYWYQDQPDSPTRPAGLAPAPRSLLSQAETLEIRGYLDAEMIADDFQRCVAYPSPAGSSWDAKVVDAVCQLLQRKMISYDEIRAAIEQHHAEVLQTTFDSYVERNYQPRQHGFLVWSFQWMFANWSKEEGDLLDKWIADDPRSAYARAARGLHYVEVAFHERGSGYARNTSKEQFVRMREFAAKARTDLELAARLNPRLIAVHHGLLRVARLLSDDELFDSTRKAALALDPADQSIYEDLMDSLQPKWGGSLEQMHSVAAMASAQVDKNPLLALTAARIPCDQAERLVCSDCGGPETQKQRLRQALDLYSAATRDGPAECALTYAPSSAERVGDDIALVRYYSQGFRFFGANRRVIDRALVLQRLGKAEWALEGLDRIIKSYPRAYNAYIYRGYVLLAEHRGPQAQEAFANAYAIDPSNWDATRNLVAVYDTVVNEPAKAREIVDRMMAATPRNPRVWLLEASLHHGGEEAKCRDALKKYLESVDPKTADATDKLEIERATKRVAELDKKLGT